MAKKPELSVRTYEAVAFSERLPEFRGWYHLATNALPHACDRSWFDGKKFDIPFDAKAAVENGYKLYWLEGK